MEVRRVTFGYAERPAFLGPLDWRIVPGQLQGVIGPNGAGKSTLLRLLVGLLNPRTGDLLFGGRPLHDIPRRQRSRRIAFLPQNVETRVAATCRETVLMGRFPHREWGLFESPEDEALAEEAMRLTETLPFADRPLATLSGGEAQCVHLAAALAQQPELMVLDEPTSALDLYHQQLIFGKLKELTRLKGIAAVVVTHDINLAGQYCDRLLLLSEGRAVLEGDPRAVIRVEALEGVYGVKLSVTTVPASQRPWVIPLAASADSAHSRARLPNSDTIIE